MKNFSKRLKELREDEGLSQAQLANVIGLSPGAICLWETGKRVPNLDAVILLAKHFKVSLDYLAGLVD